jgi:plasmid maintenance system antidote protein VapI
MTECSPSLHRCAFGRSPESWLQLQLQHDLWDAEQRAGKIEVKQVSMLAPC